MTVYINRNGSKYKPKDNTNILRAMDKYFEIHDNSKWEISSFVNWLLTDYCDNEVYGTKGQFPKELYGTDNYYTLSAFFRRNHNSMRTELTLSWKKYIGLGEEKNTVKREIIDNIKSAIKCYGKQLQPSDKISISKFSKFAFSIYPNNELYGTEGSGPLSLFGVYKFSGILHMLEKNNPFYLSEVKDYWNSFSRKRCQKHKRKILGHHIDNVVKAIDIYFQIGGMKYSVRSFVTWMFNDYPNKKVFDTFGQPAEQLFGTSSVKSYLRYFNNNSKNLNNKICGVWLQHIRELEKFKNKEQHPKLKLLVKPSNNATNTSKKMKI